MEMESNKRLLNESRGVWSFGTNGHNKGENSSVTQRGRELKIGGLRYQWHNFMELEKSSYSVFVVSCYVTPHNVEE